jgi:hypothetical protein
LRKESSELGEKVEKIMEELNKLRAARQGAKASPPKGIFAQHRAQVEAQAQAQAQAEAEVQDQVETEAQAQASKAE